MVGCGSSKLSSEMHSEGYFVTNVDLSDVVISRMAADTPSQEFLVMDATRMPFRSRSFDIVLDKGTFDALASVREYTLPDLLIREMGRVSRSTVVIVTFGKPATRSDRFVSALSTEGEWREETVKCRLSSIAQLVNIVRSKFPGETMATVLKTPAKLKEVMCTLLKNMKGVEEPVNDMRQDHCWVYIYQRLS